MSKVANYKRVEKLMGNRFELCVVSENQEEAEKLLNTAILEIKRIEKLLTTFSDDSITNKVNKAAGEKAVKVNAEFFHLVQRAQKISRLTQGAFDLSYGSLDKSLWNFDTTMAKLPQPANALEAVALIDYRNIELDEVNQTVFLKEKGMRIGFGGIGKGYAADRAKQLLCSLGVEAGFVNASGDLVTWGKQINGKNWSIGLSQPDSIKDYMGRLEISDAAIATSGNYEKFIVLDGNRYSHTIDPRTGYPVRGTKSVSIITSNAELADAMATPITVMGPEKGLSFINQINLMECVILDENDKLYISDGLKLNN